MEHIFTGWLHDPAHNHDKVWAVLRLHADPTNQADLYHFDSDYLPQEFLTVWGRRGKQLQYSVKILSAVALEPLIRSKVRKGYTEIDAEHLSQVYPEFETDLQLAVAQIKLAGTTEEQ
jgi:predicted DNA-binding WGR domain protein